MIGKVFGFTATRSSSRPVRPLCIPPGGKPTAC
jgi:hypothetical protein